MIEKFRFLVYIGTSTRHHTYRVVDTGGRYILQQRLKYSTWQCASDEFETIDGLLKSDSFGNLFVN